MSRAVALTSLLIDRLGEPPAMFHPVVWMGTFISGAARLRRVPVLGDSHEDEREFSAGIAVTAAGAALFAALGSVLEKFAASRRGRAAVALEAFALKPAHSLDGLLRAGHAVHRALVRNDIAAARKLLKLHLVSRPTGDLSCEEICGAVIESIAENLSDAFVAPLLAYRLGGLSLAYAYRFVNTADSMIGYRTPDLEWYGKAAARTDDVLNFVPARLTALCLLLAERTDMRERERLLRRISANARRTSSPNAGWPMSAAACVMGVRLTKRVDRSLVYSLNEKGRAPTPSDLPRVCRLARVASCLAVEVLWPRTRRRGRSSHE